jgi:hypothetical protein
MVKYWDSSVLWKGTPGLPDEILEWKQRLEDVAGRHPLGGQADLAGYQSLDAERLRSLRERYGFDVVVLNHGTVAALPRAPDFSSGRFAAYRLR